MGCDRNDSEASANCQILSKNKTEMMACVGALNTRGFSEGISRGVLPEESHLTYEGVFNELRFSVGPKTLLPIALHSGFARYQFRESQSDSRLHEYLAVFFKSCRDGADRDSTPLHAVICLDISGSMSGSMTRRAKSDSTRLSLSVEAIKMFVSRMRADDSIGVVAFNTEATSIFPRRKRGDFPLEDINILDGLQAQGGTTLSVGLEASAMMLRGETSRSEKRVIMLTDVCDQSFVHEERKIGELASEGVHLTIVGISSEFQSAVCERFKNIKGFNYFCAVDDQDIKQEVFERFAFNYFPVAHSVELVLKADDVLSFEVFGSTDREQVALYNSHFESPSGSFVVTRLASVFPSEVELTPEGMRTFGGLILLRLVRREQSPLFQGSLQLTYRLQSGESASWAEDFRFQSPPCEQFFSEDCLREALDGFTFVHELRRILHERTTVPQSELKAKFLASLRALVSIAPESKRKELQDITAIVESSP